MAYELRPYQLEAIEAVNNLKERFKNKFYY